MKTDKKVKPVTNTSSLLKLKFLMMHKIITGGGDTVGKWKLRTLIIILTEKQQQLQAWLEPTYTVALQMSLKENVQGSMK